MTDVWTDRELHALLRDEPELVAIADALAEAGARAMPRRSLRASRLATAVAAVAAVAVLALAAPWQRSGASASSLALAALGQGPVLHAIVRDDSRSGELVELATGQRGRTRRPRSTGTTRAGGCSRSTRSGTERWSGRT